MTRTLIGALAALSLFAPALAQEEPKGAPSPNEIVAAAAASDWTRIAAEDLLVMTLASDADGNSRQVVIQLMPPPFSQGWIENIRIFARAGWYDNISVNRVQDNYVVQWGDPNYDNPEATGAVKPLPEGLKVMGEDEYVLPTKGSGISADLAMDLLAATIKSGATCAESTESPTQTCTSNFEANNDKLDSFMFGWPVAGNIASVWPTHCYGMVGVGRNLSPDTGSGAELYTVIGHAPRHLDRNIALVGRVIEGMEHLSSLPRGKGELGFYAANEIDKRTPILSVRVAADLPASEQPDFEYLSTTSETFAKYADARANRRDPFFIVPAGGADICNIPVPVRRAVK
ncbi:peptidylprolyl isomerase [Allopontixanthobacter sp.]|uniref:peptidylprolyl isomerase n=1 Tax=Allopontixanthobacter sp. TaxID=2906452 RepID=UPI002ABA1BB5|nr:peptidylprolyl isomerase [Allopontixanthobacter sp.]MDZ4307209.1 peptidylprolyl isomerase [Allopontixanthobacter sp.]